MKVFLFLMFSVVISSCTLKSQERADASIFSSDETTAKKDTVNDNVSAFRKKLSEKALSIIDSSVRYTPDYVSISYPNGDVPAKTGVCTDVVKECRSRWSPYH